MHGIYINVSSKLRELARPRSCQNTPHALASLAPPSLDHSLRLSSSNAPSSLVAEEVTSEVQQGSKISHHCPSCVVCLQGSRLLPTIPHATDLCTEFSNYSGFQFLLYIFLARVVFFIRAVPNKFGVTFL